jgi:integrase
VAKAIHRFESLTEFRSFKKFHIEQAIAFRRRLDETLNEKDRKPLSKATIMQTLNSMRAFILWLAEQPGYRRRIRYSDADYFRLSEKDIRIAKAPQQRPVPTPEQIESVLRTMPAGTDIEQRNRALIAFTWLTGVRDGALASLKVKHVGLAEGRVNQDPREVNTKNSKPQVTTFFPVGILAKQIVAEWIEFLIRDRLWSQNLGHEQVLTTFASYCAVSSHRQTEIIKGLGISRGRPDELQELAQRLAEVVRRDSRNDSPSTA